LTGYGQSGSRAAKAGHDLNYIARAGLLGLMGPEDQTPRVPGFQVADIGGGLFAVIAILAALRERDKTGEGSVLDMALSEAAIPFATAALSSVLAGERVARGADVLTGGVAAYNTYATKDGGFVALAALEPKFLQRFCDGVGLACHAMALVPGAHQEDLKHEFRAVFAAKTRDEWARFGDQHDCCLEPVLAPAELLDDIDFRRSGVFFRGTTKDELESFRTPVTPRDVALGTAPRRGEHAHAILGDAGFSADEVERLREAGIVR
jgi:crotonobetainyl-CoA:carnitine CoA-transferase CaiB-like acyl-CoA transferase